MRLLRSLVLVSFVFLLFGAEPEHAELSCREIIEHMLDSVQNIRSQTFDVKATERVGKHLLIGDSYIKINFSPRKIYFHSAKGVEALWVEGSNKGNAIVHTSTIPLINFDLDPYGSIMRKDQHHTLFDLGSHYVANTIRQTLAKDPKDFDRHFAYAGTLVWKNRDCYQVIISYPEYKYIEYVTKKGETVTSISQKLNTSDYKIRYKNDLSSYFGAIREGSKLTIPIPYSNKAILYIDKRTFIPVNVKVYDEEGLYEAYEFTNMKTNMVFMSDEFLKSYKEYGF